MATAADIGAGNSSYQGNVGIGGGTFGSFQLDTRPLEDLARYTMLYNKAEYDQRQKDAETAAKEIADVTSYDLTTGIEKDRKLLQEKYNSITKYLRDNHGALDYRNKDEWLKYKAMRNDFENDLQSAKTRNTLYALRQKEIQDETNIAEKTRLQNRLNEEIESTDIRTPLKYTDKFNIQQVAVSAAPIRKVQVTDIGKNFIGQDNWELPDMSAVANQATAISSGLMSLEDFQNTTSFKQATPEAQKLFIEQYKAQTASDKLEPVQSAKNYTDALRSLPSEYYKEDGNGNKVLDMDKLLKSDNGIVRGIAQQANIYNLAMREMKGLINGRYFKDDFNNELKFTTDGSGLNEAYYSEINLNDGLTPEELLKMRILAISKAPERSVKIDQTDLDIKQQQIATTRRGQDLDYKVAWHNATKNPSGGRGSGSSNSGGIETPAILFGEHIDRIKKYFSGKRSNSELIVPYSKLDDKTIRALKIDNETLSTGNKEDNKKEEKRVVYRQDGSYLIQIKDKDRWLDARVGTVEDLKQGFIDVVKAGTSQTEGFQDKSEAGFSSIFGTTSGSMIFSGWGAPKDTATNKFDAEKFYNQNKAK